MDPFDGVLIADKGQPTLDGQPRREDVLYDRVVGGEGGSIALEGGVVGRLTGPRATDREGGERRLDVGAQLSLLA